jgi:hypothetical protein
MLESTGNRDMDFKENETYTVKFTDEPNNFLEA